MELLSDKESQLTGQLRQFVKEQGSKDLFSGAVLMTKHGKTIFETATGMANQDKQIPNTMETKFNLGSCSKMFTAVAIAQLVEQGLISFDDPVGKVLPDYPNQDVRDQVSIHHLLTHTSGMGSFIDAKYKEEFLAKRANLKTISDVVNLFKNRPLEFPIGEFHYSPDGYEVLGAIIEAISGQDYFDYVRDHIYSVAGMENTDCYEIDPESLRDDIAVGYTTAKGKRIGNLDANFLKGTAGGSGYSTCEDMSKFAQALLSNRLISAETLETMLTPYINEGSKGNQTKYQGYGFQIWDIGGVKRFGHPGRFTGVNARFDVFPDLDYTVVVLANYDPPAAFDIAEKAEELILK